MEHLTLAEVKLRFSEWRKKEQHREPIPDELWGSAVALTEKYSIHKVSISPIGYQSRDLLL